MNRIIALVIMLLTGVFFAQSKDFVFTPINISQGLSDNQIRYILQLSDGRMVFTTSGNVNLYNGARFEHLHRTSEHIYPLVKYDGAYRIYQSGDSLLWIKDTNKLMCINLYQEEYMADLETYFRNKNITQPVEDLFVDSKHRLWLLTSAGLLDNSTSSFYDISDNNGSLQDLETEDNCLYLFYSTGEIVCYNLTTKEKLYTKTAYPAKEHSFFDYTSLTVKGNDGIYQLRNGSKGGCFFFDTRKRSWKKLLETDYPLNTLIITQDDVVYVSCTHGFWIINCRNGHKEYHPVLKTINGDIINTEISTLFYDKQGGLWIGTLNRGLLYYHPARYKFTYIGRSYFGGELTKDILIRSFAEDKEGTIYIRSQSDVYKYRSSADNGDALTLVTPASIPLDIQNKLYQRPERIYNNQHYTTLLTDKRGWIWAGTPDGLKLFRPDSKQESIFYTEDGLPNNFIHALLEDRHHRIWATTSHGISQIQVDSLTEKIHFINFNSFDGTLNDEYADGAIFEAEDGTLYFGGINGVNLLQTENIPSAALPFKPVFTNLFLRGEKVKVKGCYDGRVFLDQTTSHTKQIEFSYNQNFLTFEYSALNYQNPHQTFYRYQLEGIDTEWREISAGRQSENLGMEGNLQISYTNLPAGKYTFKVTATNNNSQWNGEISELGIIIHAPWWKTGTAYILYVICSLLIIFFSVYSYVSISRKKTERLHKEEMLLLRIRNLIEQCNLLKAEKESNSTKPVTYQAPFEGDNEHSTTDSEFIARAIALVEKNMDAPDYTVEQLSRDLCMDRTGLYRKLITLLDKSPSLFIRYVRLQRAAQLILEGKLSITEIATKVGFSSSSYLSKCFQEMYGCRPSEYAEKAKNQHSYQ